jgi:hypothetical protein
MTLPSVRANRVAPTWHAAGAKGCSPNWPCRAAAVAPKLDWPGCSRHVARYSRRFACRIADRSFAVGRLSRRTRFACDRRRSHTLAIRNPPYKEFWNRPAVLPMAARCQGNPPDAHSLAFDRRFARCYHSLGITKGPSTRPARIKRISCSQSSCTLGMCARANRSQLRCEPIKDRPGRSETDGQTSRSPCARTQPRSWATCRLTLASNSSGELRVGWFDRWRLLGW